MARKHRAHVEQQYWFNVIEIIHSLRESRRPSISHRFGLPIFLPRKFRKDTPRCLWLLSLPSLSPRRDETSELN